MRHFAHTRDGAPESEWEPLDAHLLSVAARCEEFTSRFAEQGWGRTLGEWHDLGKYQPRFQDYLLRAASNNSTEGKVPHSIVGAALADEQNYPEISLAIAAHHGFLKHGSEGLKAARAAIGIWQSVQSAVPSELLEERVLTRRIKDKVSLGIWTRFLFSALVDADVLETQRWRDGKVRATRPLRADELLIALEAHLTKLDSMSSAAPPVANMRRGVVADVRLAASEKPGAFRLSVPTGGGKTLAGLLFALQHAVRWKLDRVIVVIPFTSIIDQTVKVYRSMFGDDQVLEHHSNLDPSTEGEPNRSSSENWDCPIIVTTSVQFFETLFGNHRRQMRKLHRVANTVVVLDEVQSLPLHLLLAIQHGLSELVSLYGCSVVHCSATQPLLVQSGAKEIVELGVDARGLAAQRVEVHWPKVLAPMEGWTELVGEIQAEMSIQILVIVHSRKHAIELKELLAGDWIHLSALMCAEHRRDTLAEIRRRLNSGEACRVVSTQLVESGVDVDFPVVYRAMAGFDSLAQSAGRCNREGKLTQPGQFKIFIAPKPPAGFLLKGYTIAIALLKAKGGSLDLFDPDLYRKYFAEMQRHSQLDREQVMSFERNLNFPEVALRFQMIDEEGYPVIAPYGDWLARVEALRRDGPSRDGLRRLQPFTVNLRRTEVDRLQAAGCLEPLFRFQNDEETKVFVAIKWQADNAYSTVFGFGKGLNLESVQHVE